MLDPDVKRLRSVIIGDVEVGVHQLASKVIVSNQPDEIRMRQNALRQRHHFELHVIGVSCARRTSGFPVTLVAFQFAEAGSVITRISRRTRRVDAFVVAASIEANAVGTAIDVLLQTFIDVDAGAFVLVQAIAGWTIALVGAQSVHAFVLTLIGDLAFVDILTMTVFVNHAGLTGDIAGKGRDAGRIAGRRRAVAEILQAGAGFSVGEPFLAFRTDAFKVASEIAAAVRARAG